MRTRTTLLFKSTQRTIRVTLLVVMTLFATLPAIVQAAANMVPDYEVKLLMNPDLVLDSEHKLNSTVLSTFGMPNSVTKMNVLFMDTNAKDIYNNTWIARIRKMEGASNFELTYKKRYAIDNGDIAQALYLANSEGFDINDTNYQAQVEWGYQKKTLSISSTKNDDKSGYSGMDIPSSSDSRSLLKKNIPGKMDNWLYSGWGTSKLDASRKYGPILAKRSVGTWSGMQLYIEVWPLINPYGTGTEYVVEASFKTTSATTASSKHDQLQSYLISRGWFLAQDSLKTQMIMDRY